MQREDLPGWEQQDQVERERYEMTVQALNRCAAAGARREDLETLARECGINLNQITIGHDHAKNQ